MPAINQSDKLATLFKSGRQLQYQKNELIIRAYDTPHGVYLIDSGLIKIYSLSRQGNEHVHHFFGPGDYFPMVWTFSGATRNLFYEALGPTSVLLVSRDAFTTFVAENPDVTMQLLEESVERFHRYAGRIDNLLYSDARERCAYRLLSLANRFGTNTEAGLVIQAGITHEDLAHSINMTRETFGRALNRLQQTGVIAYDEQRRLIIKDLPALFKIIGQEEADEMWPDLVSQVD